MPFLITGLGSIGSRHLRNLLGLGIRNITLLRTGKGSRPLEAHPSLRVESDLAHALAGGPSVVVISNPTSLHLETALAAAEAGCHLFIEKPIAHAWTGVGELQRQVAARGLVAVTGFQFRFHPLLKQARLWLRAGRLGKIRSCRARYKEYLPGWHPGEDYRRGYSARVDLGGGPVLTLSHPFDYLRWLLGDVQSVSGTASKLSSLEIDTEDSARASLRFGRGVVGTVELDYLQQPGEHSLEISGEHGTVTLDFQRNTMELVPAAGGERLSLTAPPGFERNTMFVDEMKNFLAAIEGHEAPACTLDDGIRALEICLAVRRSSDEGREVDVNLPL